MSAPLIQLSEVSLGFGKHDIFKNIDLVLNKGARACLVGRNGSGKSTLLKLIAGKIAPDAGHVAVQKGIQISLMEQDPDLSSFPTLGDFAASKLSSNEIYKIEAISNGLKLNLRQEVKFASGGEIRRAALAKIIAETPDLMLLDEPTNHLDIESIQWLEDLLRNLKCGIVTISHDRAFLRAVSKTTLWLDRGILRRNEKNFADFEDWRDKTWAEEDTRNHKLKRRIKEESVWAVEGISARRKRNQGRLKALKELKLENDLQIKRQETAKMSFQSGEISGRKVLEAQSISKKIDGKPICGKFSVTISRGERIALVGANGVGKTTLLNILFRDLTPDEGTIKRGTNLSIANFDQDKGSLSMDASLQENLAGDPEIALPGRADQILVKGIPRHVAGYLKEFLFDPSALRAPVRSLSGGEKSRLILAKLMAKKSNLLLLDEPTNDLDIETLDLLQEILCDYDGTIILISHDRDFVEQVATRVLFFEGNGNIIDFTGGYRSYLNNRSVDKSRKNTDRKSVKSKTMMDLRAKKKNVNLSFTDHHRLREIPREVERLELEIKKLEDFLSIDDLYLSDQKKFDKASTALAERKLKLDEIMEEWLLLEDKKG
ncbi:MAG: ATP-binding cassette domain-containing protein [Rhodobacterales bacterium]|nr:ATP-binding cassette domain-containing protein [Rhodobacterales bacterium]